MKSNKKFKGLPRRLCAGMLALLMALTLVPMLSETVYAANFSKIEMSNPTFYESGCLKSLDVTIQANGSYADAYGKIGIHTGASQYTWSNRYISSSSCTEWPETISDSTLLGLSTSEFLWTDCKEHKVTVQFEDGKIPCNQEKTYVVHLWTRAQSYGIYTDATFDNLKTTADGKLSFGNKEIVINNETSSKTFSFSYAADCRRQPEYPKKGNSFEASCFQNPLYGYQTSGSTMSGDWKLVSKGLYTGNSVDYKGNYGIDSVMSDASYEYGVAKTAIEVYELKDGDKHIAYGVLCGIFDGSALYIGDTWSGGGGYALSNKDLTTIESISGTVTQDVTTGFEEPAACECTNVTKRDGQAATCTDDGWKDYYQCANSECGKYYTSADKTTEIADLSAWKTGEGKINKLGHAWEYNANGATLTATCTRDSAHTATLTLLATSPNYSGSAATITLGGKDAWEAAGLTAPSVAYEDASGNEISSAPTVVGTYYATITVDGKKAKVQYTIEQAHGADTSKYSYDDTNHWNPCLRSDCTDTGHKYNTAAHSYDGTTHKCVCGKIDPSYHVHVLGTKHNAVPGNCVDKGTLEYYDCAGTVGGACGKYLDAEGHELASIEGTTNASNHKGTSTTWTKTATNHKETYDCCGVVKTAEASHTSSGAATEDAAEVCTVCGYEIAAKLPHTHKYATTYSKDATGHWYAATCGHDVKDGFASHTSSGAATEAKAEVCTVCGYEIAPQLTHSHTYATTYSKDATGHWYAATCGHDVQGSFAAHSYGDWTVTKLATATESGEKERTCSICSYKEAVATSYDKPASDTDSDAGKIENTTDSSKNDCAANVEITKSEIIEKLDLTPEELSRVENGENISVNLEVKAEEPKNIPQAEKKEAEKKLESGEKIGQYLDINLFKVVGNDKSKVSQTKGEIKIEITIPSDIKKAGTDFFIIRVHNGKATKLALTLVSGDTYSFETDQFSTYAIGYKEKSSDSNNDNNNNNNTNDDKKKEDSNTNDSDNKTEVSSPKTGDPNELRGWFFALIASLGGLLVLGGLKRKEKASK